MADGPAYGECDCGGTYRLDPTTIGCHLVDFPCDNQDCDWTRTVAREWFDAWVDRNDIDVGALRERAVATDGGHEQCIACGDTYDRSEHDGCPHCQNDSLDTYVTDGGQKLDRSVRTLDLRLAISEHYGLDFEQTVRTSDSNSSAAIYFTRSDFDVIAADLGIDTDGLLVAEVRQAIREACDLPPRDGRNLDWAELKALIDEVGVDVPADAHGLMPGVGLADESEPEPAVADGGDTGPWADWGGDA